MAVCIQWLEMENMPRQRMAFRPRVKRVQRLLTTWLVFHLQRCQEQVPARRCFDAMVPSLSRQQALQGTESFLARIHI